MTAPDPSPNPLLRPPQAGLPAFAEIAPEHVTPALDVLLAEAGAALERAVDGTLPLDFDALSAVLDVAVERLDHAWGLVSHLQSVADTPELRAAQAENLPRVTAFHTRLAGDERLHALTRALLDGPAEALTPPRRRLLEHRVRDAVLGGAELQGQARARFAAVRQRLAELSQRFGENVLDATDAFALDVDGSRLAGVPADVVAEARRAAAEAGVAGCRLTLQEPCWVPVLSHARDRGVREAIHRARHTRASELGDPRFDNGPLIAEIVALRAELAALLGQPSYAHLSLVPKMAGSPAEVEAFLLDLARRARPQAEREDAELRAFAAAELDLPALEPWDRAFATERLRERRHGFSREALRPYFPLPRVLHGLAGLLGRLFGVTLRPVAASVWHPAVQCLEVLREGQPVGGLYLDLHARRGKESGAWMDDLRERWRRPDGHGLQLPLAHVVCNFPPPGEDRPALLDHDDLLTLFHEAGHALHHVLGRTEELGLGMAAVEWDAIELPSQFMEHFCWNREVLSQLSGHVETGEPLPDALFERLAGSRRFMAALQIVRMVEYGLFDLRLHAGGDGAAALALLDAVRREVGVVPPAPFQRTPHDFTHLFDGAYAAGFYGYQWAEVMASDAFAAFEEAGVFDAEVGRRYRQSILEAGAERDALDSFTRFRGRAPTIDAFLRHQGIAA